MGCVRVNYAGTCSAFDARQSAAPYLRLTPDTALAAAAIGRQIRPDQFTRSGLLTWRLCRIKQDVRRTWDQTRFCNPSFHLYFTTGPQFIAP